MSEDDIDYLMNLARITAREFFLYDQDAFAEGYLTVAYIAKNYTKELGELSTYAITALRNKYVRLINVRKNFVEYHELIDVADTNCDHASEAIDLINSLPVQWREVASMRWLSGYKQREIEEKTGLTRQQVRSVLDASILYLREKEDVV